MCAHDSGQSDCLDYLSRCDGTGWQKQSECSLGSRRRDYQWNQMTNSHGNDFCHCHSLAYVCHQWYTCYAQNVPGNLIKHNKM